MKFCRRGIEFETRWKERKKLNITNKYISTILHCAACDVHSHLENITLVHNKNKQGFTYEISLWISVVVYRCQHPSMLDCVWNVMAHAQKQDFIFRRNGRVHLNRRGRQFSQLPAAEVRASATVMLDTPCSEVQWRVLATHSIRQFPLHSPSCASPCAITFQLDLHMWFCKICTFVKLDNKIAVTLSYGYKVGINSADESNKLAIMPEKREDTYTFWSGAWESHQLHSSLKSLPYSNRHATTGFTFLCCNRMYVQYFMRRITADDADINFLSVVKSFISCSGSVSHPLHRTLTDNSMAVLQIIKSCHVKCNHHTSECHTTNVWKTQRHRSDILVYEYLDTFPWVLICVVHDVTQKSHKTFTVLTFP